MTVRRRARSISVFGFLLAGAIGIISSTQTWLTVERADGGQPIDVPGADALPLLPPLSLAVLALGAALSIASPVLRLVFGVLGGAAAVLLGWSSAQLLISAPSSAIASTVTEVTGLAGSEALSSVVAGVVPSAWPVLALVGWVVLLASAVLVMATWRRWGTGGRRYRTDATPHAPADGPVDSVDSWDELSHGTDPTR